MTTPSLPNPTPTLLRLAFEAGRSGVEWIDFTFRDDVEMMLAQAEAADVYPDRTRHMFEEFERGQLEHKIALRPDGRGWIVVWTTAPADYDSFGAETITSEPDAWHGKTLRSVAVNPHHARYQVDRYASGLHFVGDEDPRIEAARTVARLRAYKAEDEARAARTAAGAALLTWLADKVLEDPDLDDGVRGNFGELLATREQVRAERAARSLARAEAAREEAWARDTATVPEGSTIVDDGTTGYRGYNGQPIPGQPTQVLYSITYGHAWERNVDTVEVNSGKRSANLGVLAEYVRAGTRFRIVRPDEVPPRAVVDRLGHENLKSIEKHSINNRDVWACRTNYWDPIFILSADGRKVAGKRIREAVDAIYYRRDNESTVRPVFQGFLDFLKFAE